ncbi:Hypothetical_protein [Hexamita inflata]|uniref:Hypothetical_protein n=1 Tax=Hexamita inflata TaxID=28002 RepID=A0AA86QIB4_9EUKA|nr:Hypothetical protein HINF_LOCUS47599 [Hexamita inflata]
MSKNCLFVIAQCCVSCKSILSEILCLYLNKLDIIFKQQTQVQEQQTQKFGLKYVELNYQQLNDIVLIYKLYLNNTASSHITTQRLRISQEIECKLKENFVLQLNATYDVNYVSVQHAIEYYQQQPVGVKRLFDWKLLDASIGHKSYARKSYSYKYINIVIARRFLEKLSPEIKQLAKEHACHLLKSFNIKYQSDNQYILELRYAVIKETCAFVEQRVTIDFCKKSLVDMLRHTLDERIQAIQNADVIQRNINNYKYIQKEVQSDQDEVTMLLEQLEQYLKRVMQHAQTK